MKCNCETDESWQRSFGHMQPKCTLCMNVDSLFERPLKEQKDEVRRLLANQQLMSAWLAVDLERGPMAHIPRDIASKAAGWDQVKRVY